MAGAKAVPGFGHLSTSPGLTGRSLGHNYREVRSIGRGSFGEATLAKDGNGKLCVIKTIDIRRLDKKEQLEAAHEVQVLSSLKHPYIVRYHESFVEDGTLAIVMDYAEGGDLGKRISGHRERHEFFGEWQILRWFTQVALGLKYLHTKQVVHRDLKPQNIFLTRKDDLRLGDFGISKMGSSSHVEETTIGTPYYFSPEVCLEKLYTFAGDIWALGCILYELVVLDVPFKAQNIPCLIRKITSGRLPALPPSFSCELRQLCHSLLCRDHSRRPSAVEVLQGTMIQTEMKRMMQDADRKADSKENPLLMQGGPGSSIDSDSRRTSMDSVGESRRMLSALLTPLDTKPIAANIDQLKRSPSAPVPSTRVCPSGNDALNPSSSAEAVRTAWSWELKESLQGCVKGNRAQTPMKQQSLEEGVPRSNKANFPQKNMKLPGFEEGLPAHHNIYRAQTPMKLQGIEESSLGNNNIQRAQTPMTLQCFDDGLPGFNNHKRAQTPMKLQGLDEGLLGCNKVHRAPAPMKLQGFDDGLPGCKKMQRAQTPLKLQCFEDGLPPCDIANGNALLSNLQRPCASPLHPNSTNRCGANRARNRRKPVHALPVWQDMH